MDSKSLKILRIYKSRPCLTTNQLSTILNEDPFEVSEYVIRLKEKEYLRVEPNHATLYGQNRIFVDTPLQISIEGIEVTESADQLSKQRRNDWIRYIITTGIAIAAFIKSFFF